MPEQDTPRDPRLQEIDRYEERLLRLLLELRQEQSRVSSAAGDDRHRGSSRYRLAHHDDLTSAWTGERCLERFTVLVDGTPTGMVEIRPGDTLSYASPGEHPCPYVTIGRRRPQLYATLFMALAKAMGVRVRNWVVDGGRAMSVWLQEGDLSDLADLVRLEAQLLRADHVAQLAHDRQGAALRAQSQSAYVAWTNADLRERGEAQRRRDVGLHGGRWPRA